MTTTMKQIASAFPVFLKELTGEAGRELSLQERALAEVAFWRGARIAVHPQQEDAPLDTWKLAGTAAAERAQLKALVT